MLARITSAVLLGLSLSQFASAQVVINEFVYDHSSTDVDEFIEFYNAGASPVDMSGWMIDCEGTTSSNFDFTIPAMTPPVPAGGFLLVANGLASAPTLQAADVLVNGAPTGGWLQNGKDSIMLRDAGGTVVDAVTYESTASGTLVSQEQIEGAGIAGAANNFGYALGSLSYNSFQRITDGYDTDNNGHDFRMAVATPGASNDLTAVDASGIGYFMDVDIATAGLISGDDLPNWAGSCQDPLVVDYATSGLPQSPLDALGQPNDPTTDLVSQMGCVATADSIGGSVWLETVPSSTFVFEAYVYIDSSLTLPNTAEYWHIGFHGTSAEFFNLPAPIWTGAFSDTPDVTGAGLSFLVDDTSATLYLVDYSDGSSVNVLDSMAAPGGWTRIRVQTTQNFIEVRVGGTQGVNDGTAMMGALSGDGGFGGCYMGYRKVGDMGGIGRAVSPLYIDSVLMFGSLVQSQCHGEPTANSIGDPHLALTALPVLGNASFGLEVSGLVPSTSYFQLLGINNSGTGIDISAALPGAVPPGLTLWVPRNIFGGLMPTADASGVGGTSIPLPPNPSLVGGQLWAQAMQVDGALPFVYPISATKAVQFTLGN